MVRRHIRLVEARRAETAALARRFELARVELGLPEQFPAEVLAAAGASRTPQMPDLDLTAVPFMTVDPPGSTDLDQAMHLSRLNGGYHVDYAIADVGAFVPPGGPVDIEAMRRGQTLYAPDRRLPLHPPVLSEDAASLLPGRPRPAFVWRFDLDADGHVVDLDLVRAVVRSRHRLDYPTVQAAADSRPHRARRHGEPTRATGLAPDPTDDITWQAVLLREIGERRLDLERGRGGASLPVPEQEISSGNGHYRVQFRGTLQAEEWNAQLSLMTGMAAARLMMEAGVGILRTMPPPDRRAVARFRRQARALSVAWPDGERYGDFIRGLDRRRPAELALLHEATVLFRGAGYSVFDGNRPEQVEHAAVGAPYAHVTAPLRRLVDRFGLVTCHAALHGRPAPDWVLERLNAVAERMVDSDHVARALERRCVDLVEAAMLASRVGDEFDAVTIDAGPERSEVQLLDPAVVAPCDATLPLGVPVRVRLDAVDTVAATVRFSPVAGTPARA